MPVPESPDALLTRSETAAALTAAGFPVRAATLATKATRGGGPAFRTLSVRSPSTDGVTRSLGHCLD